MYVCMYSIQVISIGVHHNLDQRSGRYYLGDELKRFISACVNDAVFEISTNKMLSTRI